MSEYSKKIDNALKICKLAEEEALAHNEPVEVCYSGGKDSDVFLFRLFFSSLIETKDYLYRNVQNEMRDPKTEIENFFNIKLPDYEKITTK